MLESTASGHRKVDSRSFSCSIVRNSEGRGSRYKSFDSIHINQSDARHRLGPNRRTKEHQFVGDGACAQASAGASYTCLASGSLSKALLNPLYQLLWREARIDHTKPSQRRRGDGPVATAMLGLSGGGRRTAQPISPIVSTPTSLRQKNYS